MYRLVEIFRRDAERLDRRVLSPVLPADHDRRARLGPGDRRLSSTGDVRKFLFLILIVIVAALIVPRAIGTPAAAHSRALNGKSNNVKHPAWGESGTQYPRVAAPAYEAADRRPPDRDPDRDPLRRGDSRVA